MWEETQKTFFIIRINVHLFAPSFRLISVYLFIYVFFYSFFPFFILVHFVLFTEWQIAYLKHWNYIYAICIRLPGLIENACFQSNLSFDRFASSFKNPSMKWESERVRDWMAMKLYIDQHFQFIDRHNTHVCMHACMCVYVYVCSMGYMFSFCIDFIAYIPKHLAVCSIYKIEIQIRIC